MKRCKIHGRMMSGARYAEGEVVQRNNYCWRAIEDNAIGVRNPVEFSFWALYTDCSRPASVEVCTEKHEDFRYGRKYFRGDVAAWKGQCWVAKLDLNGLNQPGQFERHWAPYKHAEPLPPDATSAATPDERITALEF